MKQFLVVFHVWGTCLGIGGATIADILFFQFLRDGRISKQNEKILAVCSQVIWLAMGVLVVSGVALALPGLEKILALPKYIVKMSAVGVLILNGFFLNIVIAPRLSLLSFGREGGEQTNNLRWVRHWAFACGAISIVSWYTAFLLGMLRGLPFSTEQFAIAYVALLFLGIIGSQVLEYVLSLRKPVVPLLPERF